MKKKKHNSIENQSNEKNVTWQKSLRRSVVAWYRRNARTFLWRSKNPDPYVVLVSETMLQQTQTSRVAEKLPVFLEQFPSLRALATATNAEIIRAWQGMGYNSRALRLRDCAATLVRQHAGSIPADYTTLRALPGVGDYTANAILAFAYHQQVVVLDVNIKRVYSRLLQPMPTTQDVCEGSVLMPFAEAIVPRGGSSLWHQAIMDIGAIFCTARKPKCTLCPLQKHCLSAEKMTEAQPKRKAEPMHRNMPNRIWRGRTVEQLRHIPHGITIPLVELMQRVVPPPHSAVDAEWFRALVLGLVRDGLVENINESIRLKE